jgi:hypothetical protein
VRERPVLFSAPMIRALLDGRKTQTRRIVKPQPVYGSIEHLGTGWYWQPGKARWSNPASDADCAAGMIPRCPHGVPGDRLWVKETFGPCAGGIVYRAEGGAACPDGGRWKPSIFMPRWASRITLELTGVRVERLQAITEEDARAEGVEPAPFCKAGRRSELGHVEAFEDLWDSINVDRAPWSSNPFVWVIEFKRLP